MNVEVINLSKIFSETPDFSTAALKINAANVLDVPSGTSAMLTLIMAIIKGGIIRVAVDMDGLATIDSRGIGTLINAAKLLREKHGDIVLIRIPENIEKIFQPVSLHRFIKVFSTEQEALNYLKYLQ